MVCLRFFFVFLIYGKHIIVEPKLLGQVDRIGVVLTEGDFMMERFLKNEDGYMLVLFAIFIPVFLGMGLIIFDISRGNNARTDLQAAADALALAAARELDGGPDSINRAQAAMEESGLVNTVGLLTFDDPVIELRYSGDGTTPFRVTFLKGIPEDDDEPLTPSLTGNNVTANGEEARFVYVRAQSDDLRSFFFTPNNLEQQTVPIAAQAVATRRLGVCQIPPMFICNPFEREYGPGRANLVRAYNDGRLHGRLLRLVTSEGNQIYPGNFGFLAIDGSTSANSLRDYFASPTPFCFEAEPTLLTNPGNMTSVRQGLNTKFDIWDGALGNLRGTVQPAPNRRTFFPDNLHMDPIRGGEIGRGPWSFETHFEKNHGRPPTTEEIVEMNSRPEGASNDMDNVLGPSRYDLYRWEIEQTLALNGDYVRRIPATPEGMSGWPEEWEGFGTNDWDDLNFSRAGDRRAGVIAVVDCDTQRASGKEQLRAHSYGKVFFANPALGAGRDLRIDVELFDIEGSGSGGSLDEVLRIESVLVR